MEALNQAKSLIENSQNIMILPSQELDGDSLGSALSLFFTLKKMGKNANVRLENVPEKFRFLTEFQSASPQNFVININGSEKEISEMRYEKDEQGLKIYLTINKGEVKAKDISFPALAQNNLSPDLLITLGVASLENLGEYFNQNSQLFSETPVLNIDNKPANENFGEVNLIEITSSRAEILTNLIKLIDSEMFDEKIATCLLTGIVCASQNFRSPRTRPKTFAVSSFLIEKGGDHQKIIQHLYRQKNISQIKLLGKILGKINLDEKRELYSASLTESDFKECGAVSSDLSFAIEELKFNFRYLPNLLILWESHASPTLVKGVFYSPNLNLVRKVLENFEGASRGEGAIFLVRDADLNSAQEKILKVI
ncbi:MAG: hypothetical protein COT59_00185 [Candidatus Nealsonbacteria bacterium CG09_land_8_20_14_0_10_42_14]|uniref:DDH domain-containing protein n=1 Tax=Candidatus Nealsonbacteria bacterium CG09_land_8_20_14_0_10_42_14 TaxID=1974707 RepID=A0A2H0WXZ2_9BACT|nr:MAG: hypothetical protein COT59_00185 [Candidatus Nealsonbacteria bacterium CG09_land_8_20_14_0_10_42_14]